MKRFIPAIVTAFFIIRLLFAQNSTTEVFAPFVSRLSVTVDAGQIRLSWKNSEDLSGYKKIFRSTSEINDANVNNARMIARVAPDFESYIDTPPDRQNYYYAILIEDKNGELYNVFIPYRNKTSVAARLPESREEEAIAAITAITTETSGEDIIVRFTSSNPSRPLILYRSTAPIGNEADLRNAAYAVAVKPGTSTVTDQPVAGVDYYYAVIDAARAGKDTIALSPGADTTVRPIQLPIRAVVTRSEGTRRRSYPLPAPHILYDVRTGKELLPPLPFLLPPEVNLRKPIAEKVDGLIVRMKHPAPQLSPELLPAEEAPNLEGEEKLLQAIVTTTLAKSDYRESSAKLSDFLVSPRAAKVEARARFYLGQSHYFRGSYRAALMEFIFAEEQYYPETQPWIDACLGEIGTSR